MGSSTRCTEGHASPTQLVAACNFAAALQWVNGLSAHHQSTGALSGSDVALFASLWNCLLVGDLSALSKILTQYRTCPEDCIDAVSAFACDLGLLVHDWGSCYMAREGRLCLCLTVPKVHSYAAGEWEKRYALHLWTNGTTPTAWCDYTSTRNAGVYTSGESADPVEVIQMMCKSAIEAAAKRMSEPQSLCYRDCQIRYETQRFNQQLRQQIKDKRTREHTRQEALAKGRVAYWLWLWHNRTFLRF